MGRTPSEPAHQAATALRSKRPHPHPRLTYNKPDFTWPGAQLTAHHGTHCVIHHGYHINTVGLGNGENEKSEQVPCSGLSFYPLPQLRLSESSYPQDQEEGPMAEHLTHTLAWHPKICPGTWLLTSTLGLSAKEPALLGH